MGKEIDNIMEYKVKCPGCLTINTLNRLKTIWTVVNLENCSKELKVTYYRCCGCRKNHIVQLDDKYTQELLDKVVEGMKYSCLCRKEGRAPKKKLARRYLKSNKKIKNARKALNKEFDGCSVIIEGEEVKIHVEMQEE